MHNRSLGIVQVSKYVGLGILEQGGYLWVAMGLGLSN
jgi:hypothetical protein